MKQFEYIVSRHPEEEFKSLAFFCNEEGECSIDQVPANQTQVFSNLLNEKGTEGWELVQALFGKGGVVFIWKRQM